MRSATNPLQTASAAKLSLISAVALGALVLVLALSSYIELRGASADEARLFELFAALRSPDLAVLPEALDAVTESVRIALLGTAMGVAFALVLAWAAARRIAPPLLYRLLRALLHAIAALPPIFTALLLVIAFGPGSLAGVLALALYATARLALAYADVMDAADRGPVRALERAGAGWLLQQRFGIWPQIAPQIAACTAWRLHGALREALILGLVGAGGIGMTILLHAVSGMLERVSTLLIVVIVMILAIDLLKAATLKALR